MCSAAHCTAPVLGHLAGVSCRQSAALTALEAWLGRPLQQLGCRGGWSACLCKPLPISEAKTWHRACLNSPLILKLRADSIPLCSCVVAWKESTRRKPAEILQRSRARATSCVGLAQISCVSSVRRTATNSQQMSAHESTKLTNVQGRFQKQLGIRKITMPQLFWYAPCHLVTRSSYRSAYRCSGHDLTGAP